MFAQVMAQLFLCKYVLANNYGFSCIPAPEQLWRMIRNIQCARSVQDVLVQTALPLSAE
jgi:hypothetical protein